MHFVLGSEHADLCQLTGAKKMFNIFEDLLDVFCAIPKGKDNFMWEALVTGSIFSILM